MPQIIFFLYFEKKICLFQFHPLQTTKGIIMYIMFMVLILQQDQEKNRLITFVFALLRL